MRAIAAVVLLATPAIALAADEPTPRIIVAGTGSVQTPPDRATVGYTVRGEGATSDAAVAALVESRQRIEAGLGALARPVTIHAGKVAIRAVHDPRCKTDDDDAPRLTSGTCAIVGYTAQIGSTLETGAVAQVGTVVGVLGRGGAIDPHVEDFALSHPRDAERQALAVALADARRKAEAVAQGSGVRLGRLLTVSTDPDRSDAQDVVVTGNRVPAPPVVSPPPIVVDVAPAPVETQARVSVTYAIAS
ncbi:MAG: SIMPL domain-containing protein [Janthinobacterium lividum]